MKNKTFLPKNKARISRPWRTAIICVLITVLFVSTSIGMGYAKFNFASNALECSYKVKNFDFNSDTTVIKPKDSATTGNYSFVSPDTNCRITYPKSATNAEYTDAEYLVANFNPEDPAYDYTLNKRQIRYRYEVMLTYTNHTIKSSEATPQPYGLKAGNNGIVVYLKLGTDADFDGLSTSVRYVSPDSVNVIKNATYGQLAFSGISQLYRISTDNEFLKSRFAVNYDKKSWANYTDTSWYSSGDTEFVLSTPGQLAGLAQLVNGGNSFEGKTVKLGGNISLADSTGYLRPWVPIGTKSSPFKGDFDGQGFTISGLNIPDFGSGSTCAGLFGAIDGTPDNYIKNVKLSKVYVATHLMSGSSTTGYMGALSGYANGYKISGVTVKNARICGAAVDAGVIIGRCANADTTFTSCRAVDCSFSSGVFTNTGTNYGYRVNDGTSSHDPVEVSTEAPTAAPTAAPDPASPDEQPRP